MIYFCADDFGLSQKSCDRILECTENGAINKISIFPNVKLENISIPKENITVGIHLNLVEGRAVSNIDEIPLLVDERGYFKYSFGGLLKLSLSRKRKEFEKQVYIEIKNQISRCKKIGIIPIAVDSHQHTHMIPLIFDTMMKAITNENTKYIRIPSEPITPYILSPELYLSYKPINLIKQWILKIFGVINKPKLRSTGIKTALFMGVLFSGKMDEKRVKKILPHYLKLAKKKNEDIEVLFHPGYVNRGEEVLDKEKTDFNEFYYSEGRKIEFNALKKL